MSQLISRHHYLHLLRAALSVRQYRFARLAVLDWLASYPGDLEAGLIYAQTLLSENRPAQAATILQGLRRADPEFLEAVEVLASAADQLDERTKNSVFTHRFALTGHCRERRALASWGGDLWLARQALAQNKLEMAEKLARDALRAAPDEPLPYVVHLACLQRSDHLTAQQRREIAVQYSQRWPDCLPCMLHLAVWSLEAGSEDEGVALLHQAAARDVGGQVARRLFGERHPYQALWPERMELALRLSIPAEVSKALGWNRLTEGAASSFSAMTETGDALPPEPSSDGSDEITRPVRISTTPQNELTSTPAGLEWAFSPADEDLFAVSSVDEAPIVLHSDHPSADSAGELAQQASDAVSETGADAVAPNIWNPILPQQTPSPDTIGVQPSGLQDTERLVCRATQDKATARKEPRQPRVRKTLDAELNQALQEMDALAQRLKLPALSHLDGRYPVYIVFSLRGRLEAQYGAGVAALLESEMNALAQAIEKDRGWGGRLILADDPALLTPLGLSPVRSGDPWELKLFLADLDEALGRRGECIGALLLVGGPEIIPFHCLPNPVDDFDDEAPSDNPYATRDENYFIPEWPVGRLPGGAGNDARLLLDALRAIRRSHEMVTQKGSWLRQIWSRLWAFWGLTPQVVRSESLMNSGRKKKATKLFHRRPRAFGYTAAVWKSASALVFRPIGRPSAMHVSPPLGSNGAQSNESVAQTEGKVPKLYGHLGYFNLHGQAEAMEWFGQRDPLDPSDAPDYPVALRPQDVLCAAQDADQEVPRIVFSEACYGLQIDGRAPHECMALSFLQAGALAVVGSTCMSYGAVEGPLAAADLLAHTFWKFIQQGAPAGEALRQAKIYLASEMSRRQGFLDGEDQKTLITFTLYGDPLASIAADRRLPKTQRYLESLLTEIPIICDRVDTPEGAVPLSPEALASVRQLVARHLPGMADAKLMVARQRASCEGEGHTCPASQLEPRPQSFALLNRSDASKGGKTRPRSKALETSPERCSLVTLSKQMASARGVHGRVARLTLDEKGKVLKMVISR